VDVISPEEVVGDHSARGMDNGHDAFQREPLVALDV
jgi:hypothetical protein